MKKKKAQPKHGIPGISGYHSNKTYKDLKREAVIRGMPFPDVTGAGIPTLIHFINNSENKPDISLIDKYDEWADAQLAQLGYEKGKECRHPNLRLGFIGEKDENGSVVKQKRIKGIPKPKKPKRERDENNLYKGTKKSYTFELAKKGLTLERVIRRVLKKFPDASEKSIKIWYRNAVPTEKVKSKKKTRS